MLCLKRLHRTSSRDDKQVQTKILLWDFQWIWKLKSSKSRAHEFFKNWDFLWTSFKNGTLRVKTKWQNVHMNIFVSLWLQDKCHMMPFTKQHSAYAWVVTCILFLINLTFHNLPLHSSYKIHQPITDYFLRLPYSELLEKRLFRSRANRRLVLYIYRYLFLGKYRGWGCTAVIWNLFPLADSKNESQSCQSTIFFSLLLWKGVTEVLDIAAYHGIIRDSNFRMHVGTQAFVWWIA